MRPTYTTRKTSISQAYSLPARRTVSGLDQPGAFQCAILRALELPKAHRDVFLLREIQGHTLDEIAAILGITLGTARVRLIRAQREIGCLWNSDAMGRAQ
jgi:DNA-directed RNA polymerase specialized sigma24 family protein